MNLHDRLSKAFSKSTRRFNPSIPLFLHSNIMSYKVLVQSLMLRPLSKPFCSSLIILERSGLNLLVIQREISLYVVFSKEIGLQLFSRFRDFPGFGRQVINPRFCYWVRVLFS